MDCKEYDDGTLSWLLILALEARISFLRGLLGTPLALATGQTAACTLCECMQDVNIGLVTNME